jgi:DNA-binding ferritin-like protein (Dps family)
MFYIPRDIVKRIDAVQKALDHAERIGKKAVKDALPDKAPLSKSYKDALKALQKKIWKLAAGTGTGRVINH